jgi:hypothetical protein
VTYGGKIFVACAGKIFVACTSKIFVSCTCKIFVSCTGKIFVCGGNVCEQVLAIFSSRNNDVGQLSVWRPPPAGDGVVLSLDSRFAPHS